MFLGLKHGISPILCPQKHGFNGKICLPPPFLLWKRYFVLLSICGNISQFGRNFTLEGTRSLVRIFEGFCGGYPFQFCWMTERNGKVCNSFYLPVLCLSAPLPVVCRSVPHIGSHSTACPVPDWRMLVPDKCVRAVCLLWNFSAGKVKVKWLFTAKLQNVVFGMSVNPLKILIFARSEICTLFFFPRPHTVDDGEWWHTFQPACCTASVKSCSAY